jgi:hypothetical protein
VTIVAYDDNGRELERYEEPVMIPPEMAVQLLPQGPRPWPERPTDADEGDVVVLAAGRAPEGARWEWFVHPMQGDDGEPAGQCTTVWWPRYQQGGAHGACGSSPLPPETAYGRRRPEEVMAKPYGFLDAAEPATDHFMLSGYARTRVERVRLVWDEGRQEAPVELFRVTPEKAKRMNASEPFGYWVAFVPKSARHAVFEIVSYGAGGDEIGRYRWRSDVTN